MKRPFLWSLGVWIALLCAGGARAESGSHGQVLHDQVLKGAQLDAQGEGANAKPGPDGLSWENESGFFDVLDRHVASIRRSTGLSPVPLWGGGTAAWIGSLMLADPRLRLACVAGAVVLTGLALTYQDCLQPWLRRRADRRLASRLDQISASEGESLALRFWRKCLQFASQKMPVSWEEESQRAGQAGERQVPPTKPKIDWNVQRGAWDSSRNGDDFGDLRDTSH